MDSILTSIKKLLGIVEEYTHFDADLIMHINSVFSTLSQIGVGPVEGFAISNSYTTWNEFTTDRFILGSVKPYVYMKVKLAFDPPTNSSVLSSMERQISELEWRLNLNGEKAVSNKEV